MTHDSQDGPEGPHRPPPGHTWPPPYPQGGPWYGQPPPSGSGGRPPPYGVPEPERLPPYPHARPEPYHRTLRTWTYRPWRVLVGIPLAITLGVLVGPLLVTVLVVLGVELLGIGSASEVLGNLDLADGVTPTTLLIVNLSLAVLIPITWLTARYLHNLRPRWLGSVRPGLRWGLLARFFGLALVATVLSIVLASALLPGEMPTADGGGSTQAAGKTAAFLVIIALTSPLQSAGEEYFFRGYLLQGFGALVRARWFTLTCTSLLFAIAHGSQNLPLFVDRFAFGLVAGGLVMFTGGLEAGIAMHIVNNVVVLGLAAASGQLPRTLGTTDASWSLVAFDLGQFVLFAALVAWMAHRRRTESTTPGPPAQASVP